MLTQRPANSGFNVHSKSRSPKAMKDVWCTCGHELEVSGLVGDSVSTLTKLLEDLIALFDSGL